MLFPAKKEFQPGFFVTAGLASPAWPKVTPQETFVAQPPWAEVLLTWSSVATHLKGFQPYLERSRLPQCQNASQQHALNL